MKTLVEEKKKDIEIDDKKKKEYVIKDIEQV
jgi:hypothetical protein